MPWAAAIALGAIVAPPDAAAATACCEQLRPPHRLLVILEGESLFNDASALLIYRLAVGATAAGAIVRLERRADAARGHRRQRRARPGALPGSRCSSPRGSQDVATAVIVQFIATFAVWIIAERLHLSGILTMVVYAMRSRGRAPDRIPARIRIPSYAVWEVAVFVLNVLAFILVGLQLKPILARLDARRSARSISGWRRRSPRRSIVVRIVWVMGVDARPAARRERRCGSPRAAARRGLVRHAGIGDAGGRLAPLPAAGFPYRDLILFTAFCVVLGTLVVQGLTLGPLMRRLDLQDDDSVDREVGWPAWRPAPGAEGCSGWCRRRPRPRAAAPVPEPARAPGEREGDGDGDAGR